MIRKLHGKTIGLIRTLEKCYKETGLGIPVNLETMKGLLEDETGGKIDVVFRADLGYRVEGLLCTVERGVHWRFVLKKNLTLLKHRFAYAHELAHIIVELSEPGFDYFILDKVWLGENERMADKIAGYLLCPWTEILDFLWYKYPDLSLKLDPSRQGNPELLELLKLKKMANIFQVSSLVLYRQIEELFQGAYLKMDRVEQVLHVYSNPIFYAPDFERL